MKKMGRIALIGDYNGEIVAHRAIPKALDLAAAELNSVIEHTWVHTSTLSNPSAQLESFNGVWCVPGSPFTNMDGALEAIRYARETDLPYLGTCAGFQHAIIEYARNVCSLSGADHAEIAPQGKIPIITPLSCSLVNATQELTLVTGSGIRSAYETDRTTEEYYCNYGFNPSFASMLFAQDLWPTALDNAGEVRAIEIRSKPFFWATLFQPERRALRGETPPVVRAFISAVIERDLAVIGKMLTTGVVTK